MFFKGIILVLLGLIFLSLTSALGFLVRDRGEGDRTVRALTLRVGLSVALFALLMLGFAAGLIEPHGIQP